MLKAALLLGIVLPALLQAQYPYPYPQRYSWHAPPASL